MSRVADVIAAVVLEERARQAYPVLRGMLEARGAALPDTFDENTPDVRQRLIGLTHLILQGPRA